MTIQWHLECYSYRLLNVQKKISGRLGCDLKTGGSCLLSTLRGSSAAELLTPAPAALPPLQLLLPTPGPPTAKETAVPAQCSGRYGNKGWE